jgi:DNA (cytosine-5)-methyltransferase 1
MTILEDIVIQRKAKPFRVADLFCGAGGSSTGAYRALRELGIPMRLVAANHWPTAIETHTRNHPWAEHYCVDLETARPRELVPEGVLDLLMASPTCTYHSRARGGRPVNDQQRMDPWHVVRWCTELRVHRIMIENVPEFVDWGPCDIRTGRPIKRRRGEYFRAWCDALRAIGFRIDWRVLCCADYGDPTTRRRFFMIGRSDGGALRWPDPSHSERAGGDLLGERARWRGACEIIDWSRQGKSIFGRAKPLRPNTLRRILAGAIRYNWPAAHIDAIRALLEAREPVLDVAADAAAPLMISFRGTDAAALQRTAIPIDRPVPTLTAGGEHVAIVMAVGGGGTARPATDPIPTLTAGGEGGARPHFVTPLIVHRCNSEGGRNARPVAEPCPTVATRGAGYLAQPLLMGTNGTAAAKPVTEPAPTITTGGASNEARPGCARPQLIEPLVAPYYGSGSGQTSQPAAAPLPAVTTKARFGLAEALITSTSHSSAAGVPRPASVPLRTVTTAKGGDLALAEPFLVPNFGEREGQQPRTHDVQHPLPTVAATGHIQLAEPFVLPVTHHGDVRTHAIAEPLPTVTGANRGELGIAEPVAAGYRIDVHYRMLHWRELAGAMSFDDEGEQYEFAGTATEITKQIGNAVPGRTAKALVRALVAR